MSAPISYDFDRVPDRRRTESIKWRAYDPDVLPLWVADMDFVSPQPVIEALQARVAHGIFGYPDSLGHGAPLPLQEVLVERMQRLYGWQVAPEEIVLIPGVVTGFNLVTHALAQQPGAVLVQTPVYPPFLSAAKHAAMQRQDALLVPDAAGVYHVDWEAFEAAITPETRLFILCNPHNPVGRVFTPAELARMAEICLRHGVQICSDEIHCDLLFDGRQHTPIAALDPEIARHTVTLMAPSKTYNLAGLEGSFAIIQDRALREQVQAAGKGLVGWVNLMALVATEAAYRDGQDWLDQVLAYLQANRDFVSQTVAADLPGVKVAPAEGTYLAWLDCRGRDLPQPPGKFFLEKAKVALNEGATFGAGGAGFVRLNFGCPRATLTEALARMAEALASSSLASSSLASSSLASHS